MSATTMAGFPLLVTFTFLLAGPAYPRPAAALVLADAIDGNLPCQASPQLPAISDDGKAVATLSCEGGVSQAYDWTFRVYRSRDGGLSERIVLARADGGGRPLWPAARVRQAVERANQWLRQGRFHALAKLEIPDRSADGLLTLTSADFRIAIDSASGSLIVDAPGVSGPQKHRLSGFPSAAHCCPASGGKRKAGGPCVLVPIVDELWLDPASRTLVVQTGNTNGPDGCEAGPRIEVVPIRR